MHDIYMKEDVSGPNRYQSYFTDAEEINKLMISLLRDASGLQILEPCAGQGAFVKPLLSSPCRIDAIDIDRHHVKELKAIGSEKIRVQQGDFIEHFVGGALSSKIILRQNYDAVICNPPYGLRFSVPYRKKIKAQFPDLYARESYGLFVVFGIQCLKEAGRFVFIVPDTFLTSRNHRSLRKFLSTNADITHLVQFASSRFESVNFGYGSLCILAGERSAEGQVSDVKWLDFRKTDASLSIESFDGCVTVASRKLRETWGDGWTHCGGVAATYFPNAKTLGDLAECRTGIYTGDNPRFCSYDEACPPPRINGHPVSWNEVRDVRTLTPEERINGIITAPRYVPFIRGGHRLPFEDTRSALDWSREAVDYYRSDKKARLQNSQFYFRKGLAVPMVTSGRLSASFMEDAVFDQGVVGIFPEREELIPFLLVFLNSEHATLLKQKIHPGANNSANYLKRIPIPMPNRAQIMEAQLICTDWMNKKMDDKNKIKETSTQFINEHFYQRK